MNSKYLIFWLILLLLLPASALAGSFRGNPFYFSASGVFFVPEDMDVSTDDPLISSLLAGTDTKLVTETGFGATAAAGLVLKRRFRVEFEYGYRQADIEKISGNTPWGTVIETPVEDELSMNTLMVNGIFDFRNSSRITPYLGAGIGLGLVEISNPAYNLGGVSVPAFSQDDEVFAYQLLAGVGYWILPQMVGYAEYRYLATSDPKFSSMITTLDTHNFQLGLRFYLGRP